MSFSSSSLDSEHEPFLSNEDNKALIPPSESIPNKKSTSQRRSLKMSISIGILCTFLNFLVFLSAKDNRVRTFQSLARLRRPNQFIGLDKAGPARRPLDPRKIHPDLLSIINSNEPFRVYSEDSNLYRGWRGFWPPEERTFQVTDKMSTIAEFRTVDYKYEDCELQFSTPLSWPKHTTFVLGEESNAVHIWSLDSRQPLDGKTLSWNTRPTRLSKIATVDVGMGLSYRYHFHCPLNSLWAFEFSAADSSTNIRWTQNFTGHYPRIDILERSTA